MNNERMLNVVCVNCGDKYGDIYVNRLYAMTKRHLHIPFTFTCFTDRPRALHEDIIQLDTAGWGVTGWFAKLKLFDGGEMPYERMLYLDITLIIKKSLEPLVEYVWDQPFVALRDWNCDCFNSCVMWITRDAITQRVWDDYAAGKPYMTGFRGDQECIHAAFREQGILDQINYFPCEWIASYKHLRKMHAFTSHATAAQLEHDAIILKFHGHPKPHELLSHWQRFRWGVLTHPRFLFRFREWGYLAREVAEWWQ